MVLVVLSMIAESLGSRLFKNRLLYPCLDKQEINNRYDIVDLLIKDKNGNNPVFTPMCLVANPDFNKIKEEFK